MNVGVLAFGTPSWYPSSAVDNMIAEYKSFVQNNSLIDLNLTVRKYSALADDEFQQWGSCYFPAPWKLYQSTKDKFPTNQQSNIVLFDWKNKPLCWGGGAWGGNVGINGVPICFVPLGPWSNELSPWGPWTLSKSQTLVHEWLHNLDMIFERLGYPLFESSDECERYGYSEENDPGWVNCYKSFLNQITEPMYRAIDTYQHNDKWRCISPENCQPSSTGFNSQSECLTSCISPSVGTCNDGIYIGQSCVPKTQLIIGGTMLFLFMIIMSR